MARVVKEGSILFLEMRPKNVPHKGATVDILVRVTFCPGIRKAKVEAYVSRQDVQFVTGINYPKGQKVIGGENYANMGIAP